MIKWTSVCRHTACLAAALAVSALVRSSALRVTAQSTDPSVVDPNLAITPVAAGFTQPVAIAFLGLDDYFVIEKGSGRVWRVMNGIRSIVLDLAVNSGSERGLLGIALHPSFPTNPGVYLYWTQSSIGADTNALANVPTLGNRVDRFEWNGITLTPSTEIIKLRAIQEDAGQPARGNHDGGVITFGPDGKLYIFIGDVGRRGWMQNLPCGPTATCPGPTVADDQFGGPETDDAHLTGVVLRLNDNGTTPADNPFFAVGASMGGEVGAALQKVFAYGLRNSIGMAFDPVSDALWLEQNGDDSFTELSRVPPGMNGGWIQIMGPASRVPEFRAIETSAQFAGLQQIRWPPENIATDTQEALSRLFMLPGAQYHDPEFSWKFEVAPGGLGFMKGRGLGPNYDGDLFLGGATPNLEGGHIFHFNLTGNRQKIGVDDPRLEDRVADNLAKNDITESESLLFGRNFGIVTDIRTAPNGNLWVVSLQKGTIYEIARANATGSRRGR
ncbi:MAG TPA: PQQ-dependent sugar dehydrogenase [Vicinamibacterales bacterium]|nr:PQQ-dependent sugar dehydrogenase [Vicinamibacterales bacterium]